MRAVWSTEADRGEAGMPAGPSYSSQAKQTDAGAAESPPSSPRQRSPPPHLHDPQMFKGKCGQQTWVVCELRPQSNLVGFR